MAEEKTHEVSVFNPITGETFTVGFARGELRRTIRDTIWRGIIASWEIEGEDISDLPPPDPSLVPDNLLVTHQSHSPESI